MPSSKKANQAIIPGLEFDDQSSVDPDMLLLVVNQMKLSSEKKNKVRNAKIIRAKRDELEKLLSARSELLGKVHDQLASCAQDYVTNHAKDLDKIRGSWTTIVQRREALTELLLTEEKTANQLELEREQDSVAQLSRARVDIEDQRRILAMLT